MPEKSPVKIDPRVKRTRLLLRNSLTALILKKDFALITIREVTDQAEVAYITFYRHYESLDQLLMEVLEDGLTGLMAHIETLAKQSDTASLEVEGRLIFEYIAQKADLFRILLKSQSVARIRKKVIHTIATIFKRSCAPLTKLGNQITIAIAANHIATSLLSLIEWWLENNMKPVPVEMGKIYKSLIIDSTIRAVVSLGV